MAQRRRSPAPSKASKRRATGSPKSRRGGLRVAKPKKRTAPHQVSKKASTRTLKSSGGGARSRPPKSPPKKEEKFAPEHVAKAIRLANGFVSDAARSLRCHPSTVRAYAKNHQLVADELRESRELLKDIAESRLLKAVKSGRAWAICFFLKTQAKDRGYIEKSEVRIDNPLEVARAIHDALAEIEATTDAKAAA
jgi:hypothetical protein